mgnify:CR=1 FL=1
MSIAVSTIVDVTGSFDARQRIREKLKGDLLFIGSRHSTCFYLFPGHKLNDWTSFKESDVVSVAGKGKIHKFEPSDRRKEHFGDEYLSPDYLVILRGPDTLLYHLQDYVPKTHAELGFIRSRMMLFFAVVAASLGLAASLLTGLGWWSIPITLTLALTVISYFLFFADPIWAGIAAVRGAIYVWWRVLARGKSREKYREVVAHLSDSDEPYLTLIHTILLRLI